MTTSYKAECEVELRVERDRIQAELDAREKSIQEALKVVIHMKLHRCGPKGKGMLLDYAEKLLKALSDQKAPEER